MIEDLLADDNSAEPQIDPNKNYFPELVGEGKKFKDPEALAKSAVYKDLHIAKVEKENEEYRSLYLKVMEENKAKAKLEDLINRATQAQQKLTSNEQPSVKEVLEQPKIDPDVVKNLVSEQVKEIELNKKQTDNLNLIKDRLTEHYGSNYQSAVKQQLGQLGMTSELFNDMARNHPQLLLKSLDLEQTTRRETFEAPPRSNSGFRPNTPPKRLYSYYMAMKKDNPKAFKDPKILIQMDKDAQQYGEAFFDVD